MNISLTATEGLPTKAYISIRAGDTRRQAPVSNKEVFSFPSGPYKCVIVDVFEKLGSAQVSLAGLDSSEEGRRDERVSLTRPDGSKFGVGLRMEMHDANAPVKPKSKATHQQAASKAKDYLEDHGVQSLLQEMVHALLAKQPEDPVCFMSDFIDARKNKAATKTAKTPTSAVSAWTSVAAEGIMQGLGDEELPGFPVDVCPEELPDLSKHFSLMAEALKKDPSIYHSLRQQRTEKGVTFAKVIKPGMDNRGHRMIKTAGFYAGDAESYTKFGPLFEPIICQRYNGPPAASRQPSETDPLKVSSGSIDPEGKYIVSVQARVCRNLASLRFPPACSLEERREVERLFAGAFLDFAGELEGEYLPLAGSQSFAARPGGMGVEDEVELEGLGAMFREPDSTIALSAGLGRHWPDARGVYKADNSSLWAWINEEDHLRLVASQEGSDLQAVFTRLCTAENALRQALQQAGHDFAHLERFGFLSAAPGNSGTAFTANVSVRLPRLMKQLGFRSLCGQLGLQAHQGGVGVWTLANGERFGSTEVQQVQVVIDACRELVDKERRLELEELKIPAEPADKEAEEEEEDESDSDSGSEFSSGVGDIPGRGDEEYPGFSPVECPDEMPDISLNFSLMSEVLKKDPSIYHELKNLKTSLGVPFAKVIKPGVDIRGHAMIKTMGVVAGDEDSYEVFSDLLDPVISLRHGGFGGRMRHCTDFSMAKVDPAPVDTTGRIIVSTRFSAARNLRGFRFPSSCSSEERRELERVACEALQALSGEHKGEYYPLRGSTSCKGKVGGMEQVQEARLRDAKVLFQEPDSSMLLASGMGRHWPDARGIFANEEADWVAWINEEDHLRLMVTQSGAGVAETFLRFCRAHETLQSAFARLGHEFAHNERLGYLTSCPGNLGSAMRINVMVQVPLLSRRRDWKEICKILHLNARGVGNPNNNLWELSNMVGLGVSEVDLVNCVARGCRYIVAMEEALERDEEPALPGLGSEALPGLRELPTELPNLWGCRSVLAEVLREKPSIYYELRQHRTSSGVSFAQAIKPGVDLSSSALVRDTVPLGLVAGDADSYQTFASAFNPCLEAFHRAKLSGPHPLDLDVANVRGDNIDPADNRVLSVRVRASRNLGGLRMTSACSFDERREVERVLAGALLELSGPLEGDYFPLAGSSSYPARPEGMDTAEQLRLGKAGVLFQEPKAHSVLAAGVGRDWPDARGVFAVKGGGFAAWVNEEEHLTLLASRSDGDLKAAFACVCAAEKALSLLLQQDGRSFARSDSLGFLSAMPERLGTGMNLTATLRLRGLGSGSELSQLCEKLGVKVVSQARNGTVEITTQATFGVSEASLVDTMLGACRELLAKSE